MLRFVPLTAAAVLLAVTPAAAASTSDGRNASATVRSVTGADLGTLHLSPDGDGKVIVTGRFRGLSPGFHGFHVHAIGVCDPAGATPFASAGAHLNPGGTGHGTHAGDLPPLYVSADGRAITVTEKDTLQFADIFDADGSAVIIHAAADNLANIPTRYTAAGVPGPDAATLATGDAGGRFGCGIITR